MKILFYINLIDFGGAERVVVNLANEFSKRGHETVIVTSYCKEQEYELNEKVKRLSLEEKQLKESFIRKNLTRTLRLRRICKKERPDIVVSFMAQANFRAIMATRFLKIKTLISVRNDPDKEYPNGIYRFTAKILYPLASGCVFQTEDAKNWFPHSIQRKSKIILNPVNDKFYQMDYKGERENIVTVGSLSPRKNQQLLIKAFSLIAQEFPKESLIIYGNGPEREKLIELTKSLNIEERVFFMGESSEIHEKIKNAKVFVLSSNYEGLPNVVMEAMALGLPVISTDCPCGGPRMLIENEKSGILVDTNDVEAMVEKLRIILKNPSFAEFLGENGRETAEGFNQEKIYKSWEIYMKEIIGNM